MSLLLESVRRLLVRDGKARLYVAAGVYLTCVLLSCARRGDLGLIKKTGDRWTTHGGALYLCWGYVVGVEPGNHRKKKLVGSTKPRGFVMEHPPMETPWVPSTNDVRVLTYYFRATPVRHSFHQTRASRRHT
jgi:hypothetical protein